MMSKRNIAEEWKLEDRDETSEQWNLQPAEQNALDVQSVQAEAGSRFSKR